MVAEAHLATLRVGRFHYRERAAPTLYATGAPHLAAVRWARGLDQERVWVIEDCRHVSRRLVRRCWPRASGRHGPAAAPVTNAPVSPEFRSRAGSTTRSPAAATASAARSPPTPESESTPGQESSHSSAKRSQPPRAMEVVDDGAAVPLCVCRVSRAGTWQRRSVARWQRFLPPTGVRGSRSTTSGVRAARARAGRG